MTDVDDLTEDPALEAIDTEQDGSVWAALRADYDKLSEDREPLELPVPGYVGSGLVIRYRFVALADTEKTAKSLAKVRAVTQQALLSAMDTLILACDEILVDLPSGRRALGDPGQPPIRFDERLADGMGWGRGLKARQIVHRLFGGVKGEYRIIEQAQQVSAWMAETAPDVDEDFLGGS